MSAPAPRFARDGKTGRQGRRVAPPPPPRDTGAGSADSGVCGATLDRSILYVSRQSIAPGDRDRAIVKIVAMARMRNAAAGITGALVCTQHHFAQLLEGSAAAIDDVMQRIERDRRHTDVTVLRVAAIPRRALANWSMAYSGPSSYIARQIEPLFGEPGNLPAGRIDRLYGLLVELAKPGRE